MKMVLGVVRPRRSMDFDPTKVEPMLDERAAHGQPTNWFRTVKNSPDCLLDQDCPRGIVCMLLLGS